MSFTPSDFREEFAEFLDPGAYPDSQLNRIAARVSKLIDPCRWDEMYDYGVSLMVAHTLVLRTRAESKSYVGSIPGEVQGPLTAKAVDDVSGSYDASSVVIEGGGDWNLTTYGIEFLRLGKQFGAGGSQVW